MREVTNHEGIGEVVYEESFWTGRKTVCINGERLEKINRKTYRDANGNTYELKGNYLIGAKLVSGTSENIVLCKGLKWYEYLIAVLPFVFIVIWGAIPELVLIFPVIGGLVGGAIAALCFCAAVFTVNAVKNVWLRLLIDVAWGALSITVCYLIARFILTVAGMY